MALPPFAVSAAHLIARAMVKPEEKVREAIRFLTVTTADPHTINRWADALSRLQALAVEHSGPSLFPDDYTACVAWVAEGARVHPDASSTEAKRAIFDEALRLHLQ
jgi:hypothetical protein